MSTKAINKLKKEINGDKHTFDQNHGFTNRIHVVIAFIKDRYSSLYMHIR